MVPPGLYAIGFPDKESPVVVTANYKMTYDILRQTLCHRNLWLLVLETYGINVWCAAGKGTFGTGELVRRVAKTRLAEIVSHRHLILPILGAPGVAAHEVKNRCGFSVSYATIRAADLPEYLDNGMITTPAMRKLSFNWYERLVLIPVEVILELKLLLVFSAIIIIICMIFSTFSDGLTAIGAYIGAVLSGVVVGPLMLPLLPARSFAIKGAEVGILWTIFYYRITGGQWDRLTILAAFLALPSISAFYMLNFTGCTTYTSRSGVKKEMRIAIPVMAAAICIALLLFIAGRFV